MPRQREPWLQHGGIYRRVNDLNDSSWVQSPGPEMDGDAMMLALPVVPAFWEKDREGREWGAGRVSTPVRVGSGSRSMGSGVSPVSSGVSPASSGVSPVSNKRRVSEPRETRNNSGSAHGSIWRAIKRWFFPPAPAHIPNVLPSDQGGEEELPSRVQPHEWKARGYYSRPTLNGVEVRNSPLSPNTHLPHNIDPEEIFQSLRSPNGTPHPERWIPGLVHPALPPRPSRWKDPIPGQPLPFPWECQLNPFMEHLLTGPPRLSWSIAHAPSTSITYGHTESCIPLTLADLHQPATFPFVTHFYINGLAEDSAPHFAWPVMVINHRGVKCVDVFEVLYESFQRYVGADERERWSGTRKVQADEAYARRLKAERAQRGQAQQDPMRRVDYLGQQVMFRGLEPNPDGEGWMLFLGLA